MPDQNLVFNDKTQLYSLTGAINFSSENQMIINQKQKILQKINDHTDDCRSAEFANSDIIVNQGIQS